MPKRIFIKDGGLSASIPTPTGYTVIGADGGIAKKQIESTISDLGNNYIDINYIDLYNKLTNSELRKGSVYRILDYKSVNFLNGWKMANNNPTPIFPSYNPIEIYVGPTESIVVQAISESKLSTSAYSEDYPHDVISYNPYVNVIGVSIYFYNGATLPNSSVVSGFDLQWDGQNVYFNMPTGYPAYYGHFFYLYCDFDDGVNDYVQDGYYDPLFPDGGCQISYSNDIPELDVPKQNSRIRLENGGQKVVLLDLTESDYNNYISDSLYVQHIRSLGNAYGWITRRNDTTKNIDVPFDFRSQKFRRYEVNLTSLNPTLTTYYYSIGDKHLGITSSGLYRDFYTIDWKSSWYYNIHIGGYGGPDGAYINNSGYVENNVFLTKDGIYSALNVFIIGPFRNNTIGQNFNYNKIIGNFLDNTIGSQFEGNNITVTSFTNNLISGNFAYNNINGIYTSNKIGTYFQKNNIDGFFNGNVIGNNFKYNSLLSDFSSSTVLNNFQNNNSFCDISYNFSSSTHVYTTYECNFILRQDLQVVLSYLNSSNVVQYVSPTA